MNKTKLNNSKIGIIATIALVVAILGVMAFIICHQRLEEFLGTEIFKLSYQFLLLVVIGGAISLIFTEQTKTNEQKLKEKEKQEEITLKEKEKLETRYNEQKIYSVSSIMILLKHIIQQRKFGVY